MCATPKTSSPSRALGPTYVACARRRSRSGQSGVRVVVVARARRARRARSRALDAVGARVAASRRRSSRAPCRGAARRRKTARARGAPAVSRRARGWTVSSTCWRFRAYSTCVTEYAYGRGRSPRDRPLHADARCRTRRGASARARGDGAASPSSRCACALAVICARAVTPRRARERRADATNAATRTHARVARCVSGARRRLEGGARDPSRPGGVLRHVRGRVVVVGRGVGGVEAG